MDIAAIDPRQERGLAIASSKGKQIREVLAGKYLVPSQTQPSGSYFVDAQARTCTCPDFEALGGHGREHVCKHLHAVFILVRRETTMPNGNVVISEQRIVVPQSPTYRTTRMSEKEVFQRLLSGLCATIPQPPYKGNGRPALPLSDVIFAGAMRTYTLFGAERTTSDIRTAQKEGHVEVVPHFNTVLRVLRKPETVDVLRQLIAESTKPLRLIETDFASDGTGIGVKQYLRWFDHMWGKERREQRWVKLHLTVGCRTLIVSSAEVTTGNRNDSPFLPQMVRETAKNFPDARQLAADLGYLSHKNLAAVTAAGLEPLIPMKINSVDNGKDPLWSKLFALFTLHREDFMARYGSRNISESTFSTIKRVLGATVRAKSHQGSVGEVYTKVLCHNIRVLTRVMGDLGIEPTFMVKPPTKSPITYHHEELQ